MDPKALVNLANLLVSGDKGLLAMDESNPTCNKRFQSLGIPETLEARRDYRELLVTTHGLGSCIHGAILSDETIRQQKEDGTSFVTILTAAGITPGIKVDTGAKAMAAFPKEKITEGLDGLRDRLEMYFMLGARFAKWRAVILIDNDLPSDECIETNAHALARFAALCQEIGLVPIIEPEVLMDGDHNLDRCSEVTEKVLRTAFNHLYTQRVTLESTILKTNMVLPGSSCRDKISSYEVAQTTVKCLLRSVPAAVCGVAFLSGGQSSEMASTHLNEMNRSFKSKIPWPLTFSFSRAVQQPVLECWRGEQNNILPAQKILLQLVKNNQAARRGEYKNKIQRPSIEMQQLLT